MTSHVRPFSFYFDRTRYGWLIKTLGKAVVVGEWGGRCVVMMSFTTDLPCPVARWMDGSSDACLSLFFFLCMTRFPPFYSCNGKDGTVQEHLAQWMVDNCLTSNFWWALNPGSADTDGLMSPDWTHYDERCVLDHVAWATTRSPPWFG